MRYDLVIESPEYVKELAQHHVGGYLKIAPEHVREGPLSMMMKPGVGTYYRFKELFDKYSKEAGRGAVPHPVLHRRASGHYRRGHAGACDLAEEERLPRRPGAGLPALADGLGHGHVPQRQEPAVAASLAPARTCPSPGVCVSDGCTRPSCATTMRTTGRCCARRLRRMGKAHLIGSGPNHLIPAWQPKGTGQFAERAAQA